MKQRLWVVLGLLCISGCACETVSSGHGGIGFDSFGSGTQREPYGEGLHVLRPGKSLITYDLRVQEMKDELSVLSNNGLDLKVDSSVRYRVDPAKLFELHTQTGPRYADILIAPIARSEARKVFGRYAPEEIYSTKREQIEKEIQDEVTRALQGKHVVVEAILVRDVTLPAAIREAIADKLAEEQRSQKMRFTLDKERQEAERRQIEAEGIAKYQNIVRQGLTEEYLRFKGIEATEKLASSPNAKVVVVGGGSKGNLPLVYQVDGK
ncbi:prohibitin family protein [Myxococcus sp. CA051A]|uniref:prohibitin family protein n=1 Tax=unclassified Myxococcus TaxID=2648731 RepID=UPI00157A56F4|nr:prohibitin family protein [Myxococcus sp. CA056]NTX34704.1 prohibitin family protein [Myxococcus sp. CA033]NTX50333.1 prohibitin family protein [Myxococcus sp. CA039A]NTX60469.1 prohibitin family protein [Myxococcus sp. CA051A]